MFDIKHRRMENGTKTFHDMNKKEIGLRYAVSFKQK